MPRANNSFLVRAGLLAVMCLTGPAAAQIGAESDSLQKQLTELRQELAQTRLQLETAMRNLEELKQFLAEKQLDKRLDEWRTERRMLKEERMRLQRERARLDQARKKLGQTANLKIRKEREAHEAAEEEKTKALKPNWSIQYMLGYISADTYETSYYRVHDGRIFSQRRLDSIDRRNVKVKGTVLNRSDAPWRYTFEIRLAGEGINPFDGKSTVLGQWRIQTPLLGAGDLHNFEVTVPVANATSVEVVQVGQVTADRPAQLKVADNPPAQPPAPPQPKQ